MFCVTLDPGSENRNNAMTQGTNATAVNASISSVRRIFMRWKIRIASTWETTTNQPKYCVLTKIAFATTSIQKLLPRKKYREKSQIETSARNSSRLYIRTSWAYLIRAPFTAKSTNAARTVVF